jgi:predicted Rossmann-fold nucleotide-binding protein
MLADIFPTGWHATRLAGLLAGESVVIYGAGPVGLMAAYRSRVPARSRSSTGILNASPGRAVWRDTHR